MIKQFTVILLLFSFALQIFPERVFATAYSNVFGPSAESNSTWSLNPGVVTGITTGKMITHGIASSDGHNYSFRWAQEATMEYAYTTTGVGSGQRGYYVYKILDYSLDGTATVSIGAAFPDLYLITMPSSGTGANPVPSSDNQVYRLVLKLGSDTVGGYISSGSCLTSICLKAMSGGDINYYYDLGYSGSNVYKWPSPVDAKIKSYLLDTSLFLFNTHPKLSVGALPQKAIAACSAGTVKQDHLSNWALMDAMTKTGSEFQTQVAAAIKSAGGDMPGAKPLDTSPFRDNAQDDVLYHNFYSSMNFGDKGFYPDMVPNTGKSLDVQYAETYASIWTWTPSDYQNIPGTNITIWGAVAGVLGVAGINAAATDVTSSIALTKAKIGQKMAAKVAAKSAAAKAFVPMVGGTTEVEAIQGVALASGGTSMSTAASAVLRANLLALIGTAALLGAIKGVQWYTAHQNNDYYKSIWELTLATAYQTKQMEYFECVRKQVDNGTITEAQANAAGFGADAFANAKKIVANMTAAAVAANANGAGLKAKNDAADPHGCPSIGSGAIMDWSVCQIAATVYEIMAWLVNTANNLARSVMGLENATNQNTTQSGPPVTGTISVVSSVPQISGRTGTRDVVITLNSPNSNQMAFSEDGKTWSQWETYSSTKKYQLGTATNGKHDIYVKFKNASGESQPISTSIIMEVVPINTTGNVSGSVIDAAGY